MAGPEVSTQVSSNLKVASPSDVQSAVSEADAQGFSMKTVFNVLDDNRLLIFSGLLLLFTVYFVYFWWTCPVLVVPTGNNLVPVEAEAEMVAPVAVGEIYMVEEAALDIPVAAPVEVVPVMEELVRAIEQAAVAAPVVIPVHYFITLSPLYTYLNGEIFIVAELDRIRSLYYSYVYHDLLGWGAIKRGIHAYMRASLPFGRVMVTGLDTPVLNLLNGTFNDIVAKMRDRYTTENLWLWFGEDVREKLTPLEFRVLRGIDCKWSPYFLDTTVSPAQALYSIYLHYYALGHMGLEPKMAVHILDADYLKQIMRVPYTTQYLTLWENTVKEIFSVRAFFDISRTEFFFVHRDLMAFETFRIEEVTAFFETPYWQVWRPSRNTLGVA